MKINNLLSVLIVVLVISGIAKFSTDAYINYQKAVALKREQEEQATKRKYFCEQLNLRIAETKKEIENMNNKNNPQKYETEFERDFSRSADIIHKSGLESRIEIYQNQFNYRCK
jgi:hypothetical protein